MKNLYEDVDEAMKGHSDEKIEQEYGNKSNIPGLNDGNLHAYASLLYVDQLIDGKAQEQHTNDVQNLNAIKALLRVDMWVDGITDREDVPTLTREEKKADDENVTVLPLDRPTSRSIFSNSEKRMAAKSATYAPEEASLKDVLPLLEIDQQMDGHKKTQSQHDEIDAIQDLLAVDMEIDRSKSGVSESAGASASEHVKKVPTNDAPVTTQRRNIFTAKEKSSVRGVINMNIGKI